MAIAKKDISEALSNNYTKSYSRAGRGEENRVIQIRTFLDAIPDGPLGGESILFFTRLLARMKTNNLEVLIKALKHLFPANDMYFLCFNNLEKRGFIKGTKDFQENDGAVCFEMAKLGPDKCKFLNTISTQYLSVVPNLSSAALVNFISVLNDNAHDLIDECVHLLGDFRPSKLTVKSIGLMKIHSKTQGHLLSTLSMLKKNYNLADEYLHELENCSDCAKLNELIEFLHSKEVKLNPALFIKLTNHQDMGSLLEICKKTLHVDIQPVLDALLKLPLNTLTCVDAIIQKLIDNQQLNSEILWILLNFAQTGNFSKQLLMNIDRFTELFKYLIENNLNNPRVFGFVLETQTSYPSLLHAATILNKLGLYTEERWMKAVSRAILDGLPTLIECGIKLDEESFNGFIALNEKILPDFMKSISCLHKGDLAKGFFNALLSLPTKYQAQFSLQLQNLSISKLLNQENVSKLFDNFKTNMKDFKKSNGEIANLMHSSSGEKEGLHITLTNPDNSKLNIYTRDSSKRDNGAVAVFEGTGSIDGKAEYDVKVFDSKFSLNPERKARNDAKHQGGFYLTGNDCAISVTKHVGGKTLEFLNSNGLSELMPAFKTRLANLIEILALVKKFHFDRHSVHGDLTWANCVFDESEKKFVLMNSQSAHRTFSQFAGSVNNQNYAAEILNLHIIAAAFFPDFCHIKMQDGQFHVQFMDAEVCSHGVFVQKLINSMKDTPNKRPTAELLLDFCEQVWSRLPELEISDVENIAKRTIAKEAYSYNDVTHDRVPSIQL